MDITEKFLLPFGAKLGEDLIWCQILNRVSPNTSSIALFLDRDGVIVEEVNYLSKPQDVHLISGVADVIAHFNNKLIPVILVTNQAGIGKSKISWGQFAEVQEKIISELDMKGAFINAVFACPFHEDAKVPYKVPDHPCRKPNPGMFFKASDLMSLNLSGSIIIGDRASDLEAGKNAGLSKGIHVGTGYGSDKAEREMVCQLASKEFQIVSLSSIGQLEAEDCFNLLPPEYRD